LAYLGFAAKILANPVHAVYNTHWGFRACRRFLREPAKMRG
jgi:hypothetical protein